MTKNKEKEQAKIIKKYFKDHRQALPALCGELTAFGNPKTFNGITLDYIQAHLLNNEINLNETCKILFKLCKKNILAAVPCSTANDITFHYKPAMPPYYHLKIKKSHFKIEKAPIGKRLKNGKRLNRLIKY